MSRPAVPVALAAIFICGFFLIVYPARGHERPLGFDTSRYMWRNSCVASGGLAGLRTCDPPLATAMPSRVGYPLVTLPLRSVLGVGPASFAAAIPGILAAAMGLAAGALMVSRLRDGPPSLAVIAAVVGTSTVAVRMAAPEGYADAMLATALALGGITAALTGLRGAILGGVLLAGSGLSHWPTFAIFAMVAAAGALLLVPDALRQRAQAPLREAPSARLVLALAIGAGLWVAALLVVVSAAPDRFFADPVSARRKLAADLSAHLLPVGAPAAIVGAFALSRREPGGRRIPEALLVGWIAVVGGAALVWVLAPRITLPLVGTAFPLHRVLLASLFLPILAGLGLLWLSGSIASRRVRSWAMVLGILLWSAVGFSTWVRADPFADAERLAEAKVAAAYLEAETPSERGAIFVVDGVGPNPFTDLYQVADNIREALPAERIPRAVLYLGTAENLMAGRPTLTGETAYDAASRFRWSAVAAVRNDPHAVLVLRSLSPAFHEVATAEGWSVVGPGVAVSDPHTRFRIGAPRTDSVRTLPLMVSGLGGLLLLSVVGLGWGRALLHGSMRSFEVLALAPAIGAALIIWAGIVTAPLGALPAGVAGIVLVIVVGVAGWSLDLWKRRRAGTGA